jgi:hypothetical protein
MKIFNYYNSLNGDVLYKTIATIINFANDFPHLTELAVKLKAENYPDTISPTDWALLMEI